MLERRAANLLVVPSAALKLFFELLAFILTGRASTIYGIPMGKQAMSGHGARFVAAYVLADCVAADGTVKCCTTTAKAHSALGLSSSQEA